MILDYSYPYIIIVGSIISITSHLAFRLDQRIVALTVNTVKNWRNVLIVLGNWALHAFGILAFTELKDPVNNSLLLLLVPLPTIFYILTSPFTDPSKLRD